MNNGLRTTMTSEEARPGLTVHLFGKLQTRLDGTCISGNISSKAEALLVYLIVENDRAHRREFLAEMFWPEKPPGKARNNLRQTLTVLRTTLGDRDSTSPYLHVTRDEIRFNTRADIFADINEFTNLLETSAIHGHKKLEDCEECEDRLVRAIALYQGDFLEDSHLIDSPMFQEWSLIQRETLKRKIVNSLQKLISVSQERQDFLVASEYARRLVELEPWDENNQRLLMQTLAQSGNRSAALKQYEVCQKTIFEEFGVEITKETTALYEAIREGKWDLPIIPQSSEIISQRQVSVAEHSLREPEAEEATNETKRAQKSTAQSISRTLHSSPIALILGISITFLATLLLISNSFQHWFHTDSIKSQPAGFNPTEEMYNPIVHPTSTTIPEQLSNFTTERDVLIALYQSTNGENWTVTDGWLSEESHCNWYGVKCGADVVTKLQLPNNNLQGYLPSQLSELSDLAVLDLRENKIEGGIPATLGYLNKLAELNLSYNHLEGKIPPELGKLENLVVLSLKGNAGLIGTIPPELGNLRSLGVLQLSSYDGGTQLYGWIPPEIGNLTRLTHLEICNSNISGPIPSEIGNLTGLVFIDLSNNPLSGELPEELGNLTNVVVFFLGEGKNYLRGPLPTTLVNLNKIELFQFHSTDICEPRDPLLQAWLSDVPELYRTGVLCDEEVEN